MAIITMAIVPVAIIAMAKKALPAVIAVTIVAVAKETVSAIKAMSVSYDNWLDFITGFVKILKICKDIKSHK